MNNGKKKLSIISFTLVIVTLLAAIISDCIIFHEAILTFLFGAIFSAVVFVLLCAVMLLTIVLVFGVFLLQNYGFWPLNASLSLFKEILSDIQITSQQVTTFQGLRIAFITICILLIIFSLVVLKKKEDTQTAAKYKSLSFVSLAFAILGVFVGIGMVAIVSMAV